MMAIEQALMGERRCPDDVKPLKFLFEAINSILNHLATSAENRSTCLLTDEMSDNIGDDKYDINSRVANFSHRSKEVKAFLASLKDDPLAYDIASFIIYYSIDKPAELASQLKIDEVEINNAKRRLKRRVADWHNNYSQANADREAN
jgi:hypothetical protein